MMYTKIRQKAGRICNPVTVNDKAEIKRDNKIGLTIKDVDCVFRNNVFQA